MADIAHETQQQPGERTTTLSNLFVMSIS
jgi:hypothetical protein